jgi:ligand-binding SRPBCC domain-containing protein
MMQETIHLVFESPVNCSFEKVSEGFDVHLFRALCPPFPLVLIRRFDGIHKDDRVELELNFLLFRWTWSGRISLFSQNSDELCFVDNGEILPPFLSYWQHEHRIVRDGSFCRIIDDIRCTASKGWPDFLVKFLVQMQMNPRKKMYKSYFEKA